MKSSKLIPALLLALGAALGGPAAAQDFPSKSIEIIVPFAPGGIADILPRVIAPRLREEFKQSVIVINKPGASGNTGTAAFVQAPPDGHTMLEAPLSTLSVNAALFGARLPYDPERDLLPVAPLATLPLFLAVHPSLPVSNFAEFVAYAKSHPDLSYGSAGIGGSNHLAGEMLRFAAGFNVLHVPFNGSAPALNALLGGHVQWMFDSGRVITYAKAGKLKIIAVSTAKRLPDFPDIPTVAETFPGFEATGWHGIVAPPRTPRKIIDRWNAAISKALTDPEVKQALAAQALIPFIASPEEFSAFIRSETKKWAEVVRRSGATAE